MGLLLSAGHLLWCRGETSRWWSWEILSRYMQSRRWLELVLLFLGHQRKWWRHPTQCPLFARDTFPDEPGWEALLGEAPADGEAPAEDEQPHDTAGPSREPMSLAEGRRQVQRRRQKCANTLHDCLRVMCNDMNSRLRAGLAHLPTPLEVFFAEAVGEVKTMGGVESLMIKLSGGGLDGVIKTLLDRFCSASFARALGFEKLHNVQTDFLRKQDKAVVDSMWRLVIGLTGQLATTSMSYQTPPFSFALLRSRDPAQVRQCLQELRHGFESLERMEQGSWGDSGCKDFVDGCLVGMQQYVREIFVRLAECGWGPARIPHDVLDHLGGFTRSWGSSLVVEEMFSRARTVATQNRKHSLDGSSFYNGVSVGSRLMEDYGRMQVPIAQAARVAAPVRPPPATFQGTGHKSSIGDEKLDELGASKAPWPTLSPQSLKLCPLAWHLLIGVNGRWERTAKAYLSALMLPGTLAIHRQQRRAKLALMSSNRSTGSSHTAARRTLPPRTSRSPPWRPSPWSSNGSRPSTTGGSQRWSSML